MACGLLFKFVSTRHIISSRSASISQAHHFTALCILSTLKKATEDS